MIEGKYITAADAAKRHNVTTRRIQRLAAEGRIPGSMKKAGVWLLPADFTVTPPTRRRRKTLKIQS